MPAFAEKEDQNHGGHRRCHPESINNLPAKDVGQEAGSRTTADTQQTCDTDGQGRLDFTITGQKEEGQDVDHDHVVTYRVDGPGAQQKPDGRFSKHPGCRGPGRRLTLGCGFRQLIRGAGFRHDVWHSDVNFPAAVGRSLLEEEVGNDDHYEEGDAKNPEGPLPPQG